MTLIKEKVSEQPRVGNIDDFVVHGIDKSTGENAIADMSQLRADTLPVKFTAPEHRQLPVTGDTIRTLFGKVQRWFADLGRFAFASSIDWENDVTGKPEIAPKSYIDNADAALDGRMTSEVARAKGAEQILGARIAGEITRAEEAEVALGGRISAEIARALEAEAALEEIRDIAEGAAKGIVFDTEAQMFDWLDGIYARPGGLTPDDMVIGQHLLIKEQDVPDYWWTGEGETPRERISPLEAQKVVLAGYATREEMIAALSAKANQTEMEAMLAGKAGKVEMETLLGAKAGRQEMEDLLAGKAGRAEMNNALAAKLDAAFFTGYNTAADIAAVPVTKRSVLATPTADGTLGLDGSLPDGYELHIVARNAGAADITVTLLNDDEWESRNTAGEAVDSVVIPAGGSVEINILKLDKLIVKTNA